MLGVSSTEKRSLFTPLMQQGKGALEEERKRKVEGEQDLLKEVRVTLKKWVQECLVREEKQKRLLEKGHLKCRFQAKWSEGLHDKLKQLIVSYGGKLAADCEKENGGGAGKLGSKHPVWLPRNERWLVAFDIAAFEAFMVANPEVIEPHEAKVRAFVEEFVARDAKTLSDARAKELSEALEARFGPLRRALLERAKATADASIVARKKGTKRKEAPTDKDQQGKRPRAEVPLIETVQDAAWAAAVLAPMGLHGEGTSSTFLVKAPASVSVPILEGLRSLNGTPDFHEALRKTAIGRVVNACRHHTSPEVAKAAKDLVASWKAACKGASSK